MRRTSIVVLSLTLAGCGQINVERRVQAYRESEARRLIAEYQQARAGGDLVSMCVKSNLVSGVYLDANDAGSAQAWKARNAEDCRAARAVLGLVAADG
jgi:hypothetical protein